ncbi:transcription termination/antitermination factor NusG [Candidatus Poribacteria bacterium]|nr:transcription termination/antitermination factor NusG [Candidatus Poribacteria bacterium]
MPWYVLHTYSGHEKKVKSHLEQRVRAMARTEQVLEVRIPVQMVSEVKDGKKRSVERNVFPGYVFVQVSEDLVGSDQDDLWAFIKQTPGVMGFLGTKSQPTALSDGDVPGAVGEGEVYEPEPVVHIEYGVGDSVRVIEGPFAGFTGQVTDVDMQKQRLKLAVSIFGRATPLELDFLQVERT